MTSWLPCDGAAWKTKKKEREAGAESQGARRQQSFPFRCFAEGGCPVGRAVLQTILWDGTHMLNPVQGVFFPLRRRERPLAHVTSVLRRPEELSALPPYPSASISTLRCCGPVCDSPPLSTRSWTTTRGTTRYFGTCGRSRCEERGLHAQRSLATVSHNLKAALPKCCRLDSLTHRSSREREIFSCVAWVDSAWVIPHMRIKTHGHNPHSCSHTRTRHTAYAHDTHAIRVAHDTCTNIRETYKTHTAHMTHTRHAQNTRQTHMTRHVNPRGVRLIVFANESHLISSSLEITTNCHPQVGSQVLSVFFFASQC